MKTTKSNRASAMGSLYNKAKEVVGEILSGAATGAVSGAAESAVNATGDKTAAPRMGANGHGRITKETPAKASGTQKTSAARAKSTAKSGARTKPVLERSPVKKSGAKSAATSKTAKRK